MADLNLYFNKLLQHEGGFTVDTGGATKLGVTLATWQAFGRDLDGDNDIDADDIKLLTPELVLPVYKKAYWDIIKGDQIKSQVIAELLFDHAVNAGVTRAIKMMQWILKNHFNKNLGPAGIDGVIGNYTLSAINSVNASELAELYKTFRIYYYQWLAGNTSGIPKTIQEFFKDIRLSSDASKYSQYLNGWLSRVNSFIIKGGATSIIPLVSLILGGAGLYWLVKDK